MMGKPIHPIILMVIGILISAVSFVNPDVRSKLVLFFWIGIVMIVYGGFRLFVARKATNYVAQQQTGPTPVNHNPQQTWQHTQQDPFPQHQYKQEAMRVVACPNCHQAKNALHRFCPHCGYGV